MSRTTRKEAVTVAAKADDGYEVSLEVPAGSPDCELKIAQPADDDGVENYMTVKLLKHEMADFLLSARNALTKHPS